MRGGWENYEQDQQNNEKYANTHEQAQSTWRIKTNRKHMVKTHRD